MGEVDATVHVSVGDEEMLRALTITALLALNVRVVAADDTIAYDSVGWWTIGVDKTLGYSCFAVAEYEDHSFLRVQWRSSYEDFLFIVGDPRWRSLEDGREYRIDIQFDDFEPWSGDATAGTLQIKILTIPIPVQFVQEFRRAEVMDIFFRQSSIGSFLLDGSAKALTVLAECQERVNGIIDEVDPFQGNVDDPFANY